MFSNEHGTKRECGSSARNRIKWPSEFVLPSQSAFLLKQITSDPRANTIFLYSLRYQFFYSTFLKIITQSLLTKSLIFFSQSACSKITTDGCKNVTSLTKAVPGSKVDACGVSCCYTDKCNTKDLVVLSKPTAKSVAPFSEVSLIINLLVFLLSAGIAVTAIQWKEASSKGRHFGFLQGRDNNSGFGVLTLSNYLSL